MNRTTVRDLLLSVPAAVIAGAGLAAIQPGPYWAAWAGFAALFLLGIWAIVAAWRWAGSMKVLGWMTFLALTLRLAAGVAAYLILPIDGYNEPDDRAGFVFTDAHRRDDQAWQLATSDKPLWLAFNRTYYTDQYGGLLALSALSYKAFSPDAHRPLLVLSLAALTAALGVPFFFRATRLLWDVRLAGLASWIFVLYPESVLTGGAQMREPFLLTFMAVALYGFASWSLASKAREGMWIAAALVGMLLVSPAIAIACVILFGIWWRLNGDRTQLSWAAIALAACVLIGAVAFLSWSVASRDVRATSLLGMLGSVVKESINWVVLQLERGSGQVQNVFSKLPPVLQFVFVVGYGITQPVLPPAFFEPTTLTWRVIAIIRALGWYAFLPLLLYAPLALRHLQAGFERRVWTWLTIFGWAWILVCAVRAGGDQWDNPRYRLIFLGVQALVAAFGWRAWREHRDAWLPRILAAEIVCSLIFGQWYVARYYLIGIHLPILVVLGSSISAVLLILLGGILWDRRKARG
jgi:hypothetical protein